MNPEMISIQLVEMDEALLDKLKQDIAERQTLQVFELYFYQMEL